MFSYVVLGYNCTLHDHLGMLNKFPWTIQDVKLFIVENQKYTNYFLWKSRKHEIQHNVCEYIAQMYDGFEKIDNSLEQWNKRVNN